MQTGYNKTNSTATLRAVLGIGLTALFLLAFAAPAYATDEHLFDPVLSLTESTVVNAEDEVPDPGTTHPAKRFELPCGTATDPHGDIYVSSPTLKSGAFTGGRIDVFNPQGEFLLRTATPGNPCGLAVDSEGNFYSGAIEGPVELFHPDAYPPTASTTYSPVKAFNLSADLGCSNLALAVDPSNDHFYLSGGCGAVEYGSEVEGSSLIEKVPAQLEAPPGENWSLSGIDVYGKSHDLYAAVRRSTSSGGNTLPSRVLVFDSSDGHVKCEIIGAKAPDDLAFQLGASIAVDQSNGDVYVYSINQTTVYQFSVKGEECGFIGKLPVPPTLKGNNPFGDITVDDPIVEGEAGYESPNEGYAFVTSGIGSSSSHLFAYKPVFPETFHLTVNLAGTGSGTVQCKVEGGPAEACRLKYPPATKLTLLASADPGSTFAGFSGACSGTGSCKVTMTEAKSVTAEFTKEESGPVFHKLTVSIIGNGSVRADTGTISGCASAGGSSCEGEYEQGAQVTLTETPDEGSLFNGWQTLQCDESTASTCEVTIGSGDEGLAASFTAAQTLKVSTEGPGTITSSPGLISCTPFCEDSFPQGTKVTLTATPAPGSLLIAWKHCDSGGVLGSHCTVTMDKAKTVTAVFASGHALTVKSSGLGKVQSSPAGISCLYGCLSTTAVYNATTKVTLKATPAKHFHFAGFSGDCTGTGPCEVSMGADREVKALFTRNTAYGLTLTRTGAGKGIVKSHPAGINCGFTCISVTATYDEGEEVLLEVSKVALGSTFGGWSGGGCSGTAPTCTVAISEAKEVKAEFK